MESSYENELLQWELYKSYGEFNLLFEGVISECKKLTIELIRLSYNYFEEEDDEEVNVLPDDQQDRLIKILMHNLGVPYNDR